tara:strand:+ start:34 stop:708 length:675 start_codon:yes stop_codon:yes gene_type:complete
MKKSELIHLLEKYAALYKSRNKDATKTSIYVVGSQSIWGVHESTSNKIQMSYELDVIPENYTEELDNDFTFVIGELSAHHQHFNTAIDIVEESTIKAGENWKDRCKKEIYNFESLSLEVNYLDPHDLVFAKMIAGREKDLEYVEEMFRCNILSIKKLNFIFNTELDKELINEDSYENIQRKLNYFISKHVSPAKKIRRYSIEDGIDDSIDKWSSKSRKQIKQYK